MPFGFPSTFVPMYQLSACTYRVRAAHSLACSTHSASAVSSASIASTPSTRHHRMASVIHSTWCSIVGSMFVSTEGERGPVTVNKFGNPETASPKKVTGPFSHFSLRRFPSIPTISIAVTAPVMASYPVAKTIASTSISLPFTLSPFGVAPSSPRPSLKSISSTFLLLKVSKYPWSTQGLFVPTGWLCGQSLSAVFSSFTVALIFSLMNSAHSLLASASVSRSE
mmetsp:Transcript_56108/g.109841  ORF Transcript_56108/g.109841 Transcript_56108/m.109841 type:complete len:224 (-) Transcript_56108:500-1171(-)